jgi:Pyridoxamine 5'-phosphate oxidase
MDWHQFEGAAPEPARLGRSRFEATRVALLGSLRGDGSPRISPVEPYLVMRRLLIGALGSSQKARDLLRDPRCTLHSSVSNVNGSEGEFKVHGRAILVTDEAVLRGDYEAWWTAPGASPRKAFSIDIVSAAHIAWNIDSSEMTVMCWDADRGLRRSIDHY